MASKRRLRRQACGSKRKFATRKQAEDSMFACVRAGKSRGGKVRAYSCAYCGQFHWGHYSLSSY